MQSIANLFEEIDSNREAVLLEQKELEKKLKQEEQYRDQGRSGYGRLNVNNNEMYRRNTTEKVEDDTNSDDPSSQDQQVALEQAPQQAKKTTAKNFTQELQQNSSNTPNLMNQKQLQSQGGSTQHINKNIEKERLMQEQIQKMKISEKEKLEAHLMKMQELQQQRHVPPNDNERTSNRNRDGSNNQAGRKGSREQRQHHKSNSPMGNQGPQANNNSSSVVQPGGNNGGKKMVFTSSMLKMGYNSEKDNNQEFAPTSFQHDPNLVQSQYSNHPVANPNYTTQPPKGSRLVSKNNCISSTGMLKRDYPTGIRGGGSPITSNDRGTGGNTVNKTRSNNQIKMGAGNFFSKDSSKNINVNKNQSPKNGDFGKKNYNGTGSKDRSNDAKKPFN